MNKITLTLTALLLIAVSCNKIDTSKEVFTIINPVEVTPWEPEYAKTVIRKIYMEEFTGHTCTFCPSGARILKAIMDEDSTVVATAIHCTSLANPSSNPIFANNYKTPMGDVLCNDFNISGLPKAMINRTQTNNGAWGFDRNKWKSEVAQIDKSNVSAGIELSCRVDNINKDIETKVSVTILNPINNPVQVCLVLQQDGFISGQIDGSEYIDTYEHNHVFRTGLSGNYGIRLTQSGLVEAQLKYSTTFKINYGNAFPYSQLPVLVENCSVVAYLLDMVTKEVLQVEYVHLQ